MRPVCRLFAYSAHPRRCGENPSSTCTLASPFGSSPQVRGKPMARSQIQISSRLIPAGAGKTYIYLSRKASAAAHPRRCGENTVNSVIDAFKRGSSPQVRGKPSSRQKEPGSVRLIPAGAGKTYLDKVSLPAITAHPRRCGENLFCRLNYTPVTGSSPQVRGKRSSGRKHLLPVRLIPAGAGKTSGYWLQRMG